MKKYAIILLPILLAFVLSFQSCNENEDSIQSADNKIEVDNLKDFFNKYGKQYETTNFDASYQTDLTLSGGTKIHIPLGALVDAQGEYLGQVKIISREFTNLTDMVMSNYYTMDDSGNALISGGSFDLLFLDSDNNQLGLKSGSSVDVIYPAKLKNDYLKDMDFYKGSYQDVSYTNSNNSRSLLVWKLTDKPISFNANEEVYFAQLNSEDLFGEVATKQVYNECSYFLNHGDIDGYERCMGRDWRFNFDIAPQFGEGFPFEVTIEGGLNPETVNVAVISVPNTSVLGLVFNEEGNFFTTTTGNYYDFGEVVLAVSSVENGEFQFSVTQVNTGEQHYNIELHPGSVEDYSNELNHYMENQ